MKYSELHRLILRNGWRFLRQSGSHVIYEKDGRTYTAPYHGSKEIARALELKIRKEMELK
ncbi:MAG: type II toxin-antitoxin system HicA family toxin [Tannerella sp.]|jgi:predicted RNA binding protein YcfA (HicA-like mRNA interferase family)|nr:type II toxin-antitoxin system HicA family toxin [Tannerella sp.]